MNQHMMVTKADGSRELFDERKLVNSLTRVGVRPGDREQIISRIKDQ
jgi:transcriptional regulator NrdR family protein